MRIAFAFALTVSLSLLAQPAAAEDKGTTVQIDLNKLPPEVAKRLLDELAKQAKVEPAAADRRSRDDGDRREMERRKGQRGDGQRREREMEDEKEDRRKEPEKGDRRKEPEKGDRRKEPEKRDK